MTPQGSSAVKGVRITLCGLLRARDKTTSRCDCMSDLILQTKLHIPPIRSVLVSRPRLLQKLDAGLAGKLTLVSAPAGFGKATLIADWARGLEQAAGGPAMAWLSLQPSDLST